jgi:hypothetical protein
MKHAEEVHDDGKGGYLKSVRRHEGRENTRGVDRPFSRLYTSIHNKGDEK